MQQPQYQHPPQYQQPHDQQQYASAPLEPRKKSKAPVAAAFFCVICLLCAGCWFVWTRFLAPTAANRNDAGRTDGYGAGDYADGNFTGDEDVILLQVKEGDRELVLEWIRDISEDDEYYESVDDPYAMLPFGVTDEAPDRFGDYMLVEEAGEDLLSGVTGITDGGGWLSGLLPPGLLGH